MNSPNILSAVHINSLDEQTVVHQFNPNAIRHTRSLGDLTGLSDIGLHLVRVEPGRETTQHHNHECSDEFVYILSGRARLTLGEAPFELSAGDFAGFPKQGAAHSMENIGDSDLVYLMGGSRPPLDICNYPRIDRRMYKVGEKREFVDLKNLHEVRR